MDVKFTNNKITPKSTIIPTDDQPSVRRFRLCPHCCEQIKITATKCKHCGESLPPQKNNIFQTTEFKQATPPEPDKPMRLITPTLLLTASLVLMITVSWWFSIGILVSICWAYDVLRERWITCTAKNCGYRGKAKVKNNGSPIVVILLFMCGIIPGLLYVLICCQKEYFCPRCNVKIK